MTLEEYRVDKWRRGEIKRLKKIIADAEEELKNWENNPSFFVYRKFTICSQFFCS